MGYRAPRRGAVARATRIALLALLASSTSGCYLMQAAGGQLEVARRSRPIESVLRDEPVPATLRERLELVTAARAFAVSELGLPDGRSFREYADLGRPYALWNVVATREFSLEPRQSCFPVTGCVDYRGYFRESDAIAAGRRLRRRGYDVTVGGVATYSTLGHLRDPVFNTMLGWQVPRLVGTIFHEMAHERLYLSGDSAFNESYATVVADAGLRLWLEARSETGQLAAVEAASAREKGFLALLRVARSRLSKLYRSGLEPAQMRIEKQRELGRLKFEYSRLRAQWGGDARYDAWFARTLNNAHLVAVATYDDCVPGLERELAKAGSILEFHGRAEALGRVSLEERHAAVCGGVGSGIR